MQATRKQLEVGTISLTESLRLQSEYLAVKTDAVGQLQRDRKGNVRSCALYYGFQRIQRFQLSKAFHVIAQDFDPRLC